MTSSASTRGRDGLEDSESPVDALPGHHDEFPGYTIEQYDQSGRETVEIGTPFQYADPDTDDDRIGYFDTATSRFTGTTLDGLIVTHFVTTEDYVIGLPYSDFPLDLG